MLHRTIAMIFISLLGLLLTGCGSSGGGGYAGVTDRGQPDSRGQPDQPDQPDNPTAALLNSYSNTYSPDDRVRDSAEEFLVIPAKTGLQDAGGDIVYRVARNSSGGIPTYTEYSITADTTVTVNGNFGTRVIEAGNEFTATLSADTDAVTFNMSLEAVGLLPRYAYTTDVRMLFDENGVQIMTVVAIIDFHTLLSVYSFNGRPSVVLHLNNEEDSSFVPIIPDYEYKVYSGVSEEGGQFYNHFISADYAALYMEQFDNALGDSYHYGALTRREMLEVDRLNARDDGKVYYSIDHVIGAYQEDDVPGNNRFLHGNGTLEADLNRLEPYVDLNLEIDDHNGDHFMSILGLQLYLDPDSNQFNTFDCGKLKRCQGIIDYTQDIQLSDILTVGIGDGEDFYGSGSFYGPNAEEVAGGLYHRNNAPGAELNIGFIGRDSDLLPPPRQWIETPGEEFLHLDEDLALGDDDYYGVVRNSTIDIDTAPEFVQYSIDHEADPATVVATASYTHSFGSRRIAQGQQYVVTLNPADTVNNIAAVLVTIEVGINKLRLGESDLVIADGYKYRVYNDPDYCPDTAPANGRCDDFDGVHQAVDGLHYYSHFIYAEYAALYMEHFDTAVADHLLLDEKVYHYGALTDLDDLPLNGEVSYIIAHAIGTYRDFDAPGNDRFLHGNGELVADFHSQDILLNLSLKDHNDERFVDFEGIQMLMEPEYNQFSTFGCDYNNTPNVIRSECGGIIEYAAETPLESGILMEPEVGSEDLDVLNPLPEDTIFSGSGSFYGPNAEEVAGAIHHSNNDAELNVGFIGKQGNIGI